MDSSKLETLLALYNPWWSDPEQRWSRDLPDFERPLVPKLLADLREVPQVLSITGPRRVGKTTVAKQAIARLVRDRGMDPRRVLYLSFDDPQVFGSREVQETIVDDLVSRARASGGGQHIFFLDEIQRLPMWELFLKKHYDLHAPVRFVVSGSASASIFRASQESLLGRILDRRLLPFGFREYCLWRLRSRPDLASPIHQPSLLVRDPLLRGDSPAAMEGLRAFHAEIAPLQETLGNLLSDYCLEGGFPEVWALPSPVRKIEYLVEQQVRKVLYEDLMSLTPFRRPENVLRFFVHLMANPGSEVNFSRIASEAGVEKRVVEENFPALLKTDLVIRIRRFSHQPLRVRQGNIKCYPIDPALRNAILKTWEPPSADPSRMGFYAENLVARELLEWPEATEVSFYRQKATEVDFVVTAGASMHLPIEVKYRRSHDRAAGLAHFLRKYPRGPGVLLTQGQSPSLEGNILQIPLLLFLLGS